MGVSAEALDVILRIQNLQAFVAGAGSAAGSIRSIGAAAEESSAVTTAAAKRAAASQELIGKAAKWSALAIGAIAFEAYKMNASFDQQIAQIGIVTHESSNQLKGLRQSLLDLAKPTGAKPIDLATAMVHISKIDLPGINRLALLRAAADGAAVGLANVVDTTDTLAGAIKVGMPGLSRNVRTAMAQLVTAAQTGNMSLEDLNHAMGTGVLPVAKIYGLTLQDVTGALSVFTDEHMNGASAMAQFATSLHFLTGATKTSRDGLAKIGLTGLQLANDMRGPGHMIAALTDLKTHLDAVGDKSQQQAILNQILPGGRGRILLVLMNQLDNYGKKMAQQRTGTIDFAAAVQKAHETAAFKAKAAWAGLEAQLIKLADVYKGPMTVAIVGIITLMAESVGWILSNKYVAGLLIGTLALLGAAWLATKVATIAAAIAMYGWDTAVAAFTVLSLVAEIESLASAFALLSIAMETNAIGLIIIAIAALAFGIYMLVTHFSQVKKVAEDVFNWIKDHWVLLIALWAVLGGSMIIAFSVAAAWIIGHWGKIEAAGKDAIDWTKKAWHDALKFVADEFTSLYDHVKTIYKDITSLPGNIFHAIISAPGSLLHSATNQLGLTHPHTVMHTGGAAVLPFSPAKKHVTPLSNNLFTPVLPAKAAEAKQRSSGDYGDIFVHSTLVLPNGKVLADQVNKVNADNKARRGR